MKLDLPVLIVKGFVLLPNNELKLDIEINKEILDISKELYENKILVVTDLDDLEETTNITNLPKIGVIAKIKQKIELPNKKFRLTLKGVIRASILEYMNDDKDLFAIIKEIEIKSGNDDEILKEKLKNELIEYTKLPSTSNSFLNQISVNNLEKLTDIIPYNLNIKENRLLEYQQNTNSKTRMKMILEDIYKEKKLYNLEQDLDIKLNQEIDKSQKNFFLREKLKIIKEELGDNNFVNSEIDILKERLNNLDANINIKERIKREINRYELLPPTSPEINITRDYIEWLLDLPWKNYTTDNDNLIEVRQKLDESHSGLLKVKTRIIEYLAVKQLTNCIRGPILCLVGPPGVGKTTLAYSIANAMNRKFVKISVGGINDEAELIGHRKAYIGSSPGKIITQIKKAKTANPVFLIDEIDKMVKNFKGDPASVLLEVLDPEQNKYFTDNYIEEEFDLSKVMFIATANYVEDIPEALRDRLEIVNLSSYTEFEKLDIAKKYLLPKICKEHGINYECIKIKDEILLKIIKNYTKEAGVRELDRILSSIIRKIITSLASHKITMNKYIVDNKKLIEFLGEEKYPNIKIKKLDIGVVNGLAYTPFGGDILPLEVSIFKGKGELILTGSLGEVMKESALVAINYIKSNYKYFKIDYDKLINNDIHIHIPNAAIKKDGPSAGIALTTALISLFKNKKIGSNIAFTGEISLTGNVLPVGGLKEKSIGALRAGIDTIYIPDSNIRDLDKLPKEVLEKIKFIPIKNYKELYKDLEVK